MSTLYINVQKLDKQSQRTCEASLGSEKEPITFASLQTFLANGICSMQGYENITTFRESTATTKSAYLNSLSNTRKFSQSFTP